MSEIIRSVTFILKYKNLKLTGEDLKKQILDKENILGNGIKKILCVDIRINNKENANDTIQQYLLGIVQYSKEHKFSIAHFNFYPEYKVEIEATNSLKKFFKQFLKTTGLDLQKLSEEQILEFREIKENQFETIQNLILNKKYENVEEVFDKYSLHIKDPISLEKKVKQALNTKKSEEKKYLKVGIKKITPELIKQVFSERQLKEFKSWPGYQVIIDKLNQIAEYKEKRPKHLPHLYIYGLSGIAKTSLVEEIEPYCVFYSYPTTEKFFAKYDNEKHHFIKYNEFKLEGDFEKLKNFLDGTETELPNKGSKSNKLDNPLVIMTSNEPLRHWVNQRFPRLDLQKKEHILLQLKNRMVIVNCASHNLIFLQKLIWPAKGLKINVNRIKSIIQNVDDDIEELKFVEKPSYLFTTTLELRLFEQIYNLFKFGPKTEQSLFNSITQIFNENTTYNITKNDFNNVFYKLKTNGFIILKNNLYEWR